MKRQPSRPLGRRLLSESASRRAGRRRPAERRARGDARYRPDRPRAGDYRSTRHCLGRLPDDPRHERRPGAPAGSRTTVVVYRDEVEVDRLPAERIVRVYLVYRDRGDAERHRADGRRARRRRGLRRCSSPRPASPAASISSASRSGESAAASTGWRRRSHRCARRLRLGALARRSEQGAPSAASAATSWPAASRLAARRAADLGRPQAPPHRLHAAARSATRALTPEPRLASRRRPRSSRHEKMPGRGRAFVRARSLRRRGLTASSWSSSRLGSGSSLAVLVVFEGVFCMRESPDAIGDVAARAQADQASARLMLHLLSAGPVRATVVADRRAGCLRIALAHHEAARKHSDARPRVAGGVGRLHAAAGCARPCRAGVQQRRFDGGARPGLRHLPRAERPGHEQRLLPAHRRQARRATSTTSSSPSATARAATRR